MLCGQDPVLLFHRETRAYISSRPPSPQQVLERTASVRCSSCETAACVMSRVCASTLLEP